MHINSTYALEKKISNDSYKEDNLGDSKFYRIRCPTWEANNPVGKRILAHKWFRKQYTDHAI